MHASGWLLWTIISATFAAQIAIFAKIGLEGVNSDLATLVRTFVIMLALVGDASKVAPVDKFSIVLVAFFAVMFLGERPAARDWTGLGLIAAGTVPLALKR